MSIKELSAPAQPFETVFSPNNGGGSFDKSAAVSENNQSQTNGAQFLNRDALAASRSDLQANLRARRLNNALDGDQPKQILVSEEQARYINKGLDGKDREVKFSVEELIAFSRMDDPREAIYRAALERFGQSPDKKAAIDDYLTEFKNERGGSATIKWRGGDEKDQNIEIAELKIAIENQIKFERYRAAYQVAEKNNRQPPAAPKYALIDGDEKADHFSTMVIDAPMRQAVFSKWLDKNGTPEMKAKFASDKLSSNINLRIEDAQKRLKIKYDALKKDNAEVYNSFLDEEYKKALKQEIDRIIEATKADFRGQGLGADIGDASEAVMRGVIDSSPLYRFLPDAVKNELVKFGIGAEKGIVDIAAGIKGANDFFTDAVEDAVVYGLRSSGVDTSSYEKRVGERRAERREFWTQLTSIATKQMSQAERAYAEKIERGLRVTPYDLPNKSATLGQAAPTLALGLATGGESITAQIIISAITQAALAGGGTYITSNNRAEAVKKAVLAGAQGAFNPVTAKLPFLVDVGVNTLITYTTGKMQGLDDNRIFESILTQTALSGGFRAGGKLHDWLAAKEGKPTLSVDEAKAAMRKHQAELMPVFEAETRTSVTKNTRDFYAKAQATLREVRADYGKENRIFTKSRAEAVSKIFSGKQLNVIVPQLLPAAATAYLTLKAGYHIEALTRAGRQTFAEFHSAIRADAANAKINLSDADAQKLYKQATDEYLTKTKETLSKPARAEFDAMQKRAGNNEEFLAKLPKGAENIQKMFENLGANKAKQAVEQAKSQNRFEQVSKNLLNDVKFLKGAEVQDALTRPTPQNRTEALRSVISVEMTKRQLIKQYPAAQGYKVLSEVDVYQDTGFASKVDWHKANPNASLIGYEEFGGKLWRKATDIDIAVVKENANGKTEIVHLEQIKSGEMDKAIKAQGQMDKSLTVMRDAGTVEVALRIQDKTVLRNIDSATVDKAKQVTRGVPGKAGFSHSLELSRAQMDKIALEIEQRSGGN